MNFRFNNTRSVMMFCLTSLFPFVGNLINLDFIIYNCTVQELNDPWYFISSHKVKEQYLNLKAKKIKNMSIRYNIITSCYAFCALC